MGVRMHAIGSYIGKILKQGSQNVRGLIGFTRNEAAEQINVVVCHESVSNATGMLSGNVVIALSST